MRGRPHSFSRLVVPQDRFGSPAFRPRVEWATVSGRRAHDLRELADRLARLDARDVDRLYGLEPVYEPGAGVRPEEFVPVRCPYCGERFDTRVDLTSGDDGYVEDCPVCCRPIEFGVEWEEDGGLRAVRVQRLD